VTTPESPDLPDMPRGSDPGSDQDDSPGSPVSPASTPPGPSREAECVWSRLRAPEFALGILCGRERARMLVHLQRCGHCQDRVCELAVTAERLVGLVPEVAPPSGFEQRVLAAIAAASAPVSEGLYSAAPPWAAVAVPGTVPVEVRVPTASDSVDNTATRIRSGGAPLSLGARKWTARTGWDGRRQLVASGACALLFIGGVLATVVPAGPTPGPPAVIPSSPIVPTADVIVAPLISVTSDVRLDTEPGTRVPASGMGSAARHAPTTSPTGQTGREIGEAWIHPQSPSWVYVYISTPPRPSTTLAQ
jgi:hypothetical protein